MCQNDLRQDASCLAKGFPSNLESSANDLTKELQKGLGFPKRIIGSNRPIKAALLLIQLCFGVFCSSLPSFAATGCGPGQDYLLDSGNRLNFTIQEFGNYENIEGLMCDLPEEATLISARVVEQLRTADGAVSSNVQESVKSVTNVSGLLAHSVKTLDYGAWYFSESDNRFLFQPNAEKINTIGSEQHVVSRLEIGTVSSDDEEFQVLSSVSVIIEDADPVISVTTDSDGTAEGGRAMFKLFANRASRTERTVEMSVNYDGGEFQKSFLHSLTLPAEESCRIISVNIPEAGTHLNIETISSNADKSESEDNQINDVLEEGLFDTVVSIRLAVESGERYDRAEVNGDATVGIPVGSLSSSSNVLGTEFTDDFNVSECEENNTPVIAVASGALAVAAAALTTVAVVASGSDSNKANEGKDPIIDEKPDVIPPVVKPDTTPDVEPDMETPVLPIVGVKAERAFVQEGKELLKHQNFFYLEISEMPENDIVVNIQVDSPGKYIAGDLPEIKTISSGMTREYFRFEIEDDNTDEEDDNITVTVLEGEGYRVSTETDEMKAKMKASIGVKDDDVPEISFSNATGSRVSISESEKISFNLSADIAPWQDLTVQLHLTGINFVISGEDQIFATIMAGSKSGTVTISPHDDNRDEDDGEITVSLSPVGNSNEIYKLSKDISKTSVEFDVTDDDDPELSIRSLSETVVDVGTPANFEVSSKYERQYDLFVELSFTYEEKNLFGENPPDSAAHTLKKGAAVDVLQFSIPTSVYPVGRDLSTLDNGSVTATIITTMNTEYSINQNMSSAKVTVLKEASPDEAGRTPAQISKVQHHQTVLVDSAGSNGNTRIENSIPRVSVLPGSDVVEGESAGFTIESDRVAESRLSVKVFWTVEGNYLTPGSEVLDIMPGKTGATLELPTISNSIPEPDGRVEVKISAGRGYHVHPSGTSASVAILDDDSAASSNRINAIHREILPSLLNESNGQFAKTLSSRIESAFTQSGLLEFELTETNYMKKMTNLAGRIANSEDLYLKEFVMNSEYSLPLFHEKTGNATTVWGISSNSRISDVGNEDLLTWNGESNIGNIGFDTLLDTGLLFGMAVSSTEGNVEFKHRLNESAGEGLYSSRLTSLQPYLGWSNSDLSTQLRASAGYGLGEVEIDYDHYASETAKSRQHSILFGITDRLYSSESLLGGSSELNLNAEAWTVRQIVDGSGSGIAETAVNTRSLRIKADGTLEQPFESGEVVLTLSVGSRWDGGDDRQGLGFEFAGGADIHNPLGISVSGDGRILTADVASINELEMKGELNYDHGSDGIGLFTSFSPAWNLFRGNSIQQFWDDGGRRKSDSHNSSDGLRLGSEIGYGIEILDGGLVLSSFARTELNNGGKKSYGIGSRLLSDSNKRLELVGTYDSVSVGNANRKVKTEINLEW